MKPCGSPFPLLVAIALSYYDDWYLQFSKEKQYYHESFINIVNALDPVSFYSQRLMRMMVAIFGRKLNLMIEKLESYVTMPLRIH
jgi:hypothetical protein